MATKGESDAWIGRTIDGRYTLLARIGEGSMSVVYRAHQHAMGREVAVKILRLDRGGASEPSWKARFLREARAHSLLGSPHTVTIFDFGYAEGDEPYLAMELLDGETLGARLAREKRLAPDDAIDLAEQVLMSLAEAHAKGIVHRDLKPDNLFFAKVASGRETVKVLDFGVAKVLHAHDPELIAPATHTGTVFGTPRYMSPEQARSKPLDARSDLYSLGVVLYEALTGDAPFVAPDAVVVMADHVSTPPAPLRDACPEAEIPQELEAFVLRLLAKEPDARFASSDDAIASLRGHFIPDAPSSSLPTLDAPPSVPSAPPSAPSPPSKPALLPRLPSAVWREGPRASSPILLFACIALGAAAIVIVYTLATRDRTPAAEVDAAVAAPAPSSSSDVVTTTPEALPSASGAPRNRPRIRPRHRGH